MIRFAICHIPPARSPFYRLGTSILGYDIRSQREIYLDNPIRAQISNFDEAFVNLPKVAGLHCMLYGLPYCRRGDLPTISYEIERILNCFSPEAKLELHAHSELIAFWGEEQQIVVLHYKPNDTLKMLHTMLVTQLAPYGTSSTIQDPAQENPEQLSAHQLHRISHFHYPYIFEDFKPHYTLLNPYTGDEHQEVANNLQSIFNGFKQHKLESICLLIKTQASEKWQIYKEFHFIDYPQPII